MLGVAADLQFACEDGFPNDGADDGDAVNVDGDLFADKILRPHAKRLSGYLGSVQD